MKQKLLNNFRLRAIMLVAMICGAFTGAWADEVTLAAGTNGSACTVNENAGIKVGTSKKGGDMTITVPANTTKLTLHAAAWKGVSGLALNITGPTGVTVNPTNISLTADDGISNNSPFTLSGNESDFKFEIELSGVTNETNLVFASSIDKRFVVWGASATVSGGGDDPTPTLEDCDLTLSKDALSFDLYNNKESQYISYETSSTGAVTVDDSDYIISEVEGNIITVFPQKKTDGAIEITVYQAADDNYKAGSATFTVTITDSTPIPTHTATFSVNGVTSTENFEEGADIEFPANPADVSGKKFVGWATATIDGTTDEAPAFVTSATMGQSDITYYAVFAYANGSGSAEVKDVLNRDLTGVTVTSYSAWSGKTATSDAVYAGNSAGGNESIQLRSNNNNSGIITTTSGGKVTKVAIKWNSNTTSGRTVNVYGNNFAYSAASDLYSSNTQGTLLGTIVCGTSTELEIEGDYEYVGLRSANSAMYLEKVEITWSTGGGVSYSDYCTTVVDATVERPEIAVAENPFVFSTTAAITCATDGATIKYSFDGETWNDYTEALAITATTTIYAKAVKGNDESSVAEVIATKNLAVPTVAIDASGITNTNVFDGKEAGSLSASVTYNEEAVEDALVTWSGNNDEVATIDANTGVVTLVAAGSVTFTATYAGNADYSEKTATYVMTVTNSDPNAPGSENNPYTVAEAIEATPTSGTSPEVYIHGFVSAFYNTSIVGDGKNYRYYISADGTINNQLLVYKGKGLNNVAFSNADDLQIGDEVVIYGGLTTYSNAAEIASGNYIVSLVRKTAKPIISGYDKYLNSTAVTITCATEGATIQYSLDNGKTWNVYTEPFNIYNQTVTVWAKATKDELESEVASMTFTCMNNKEFWVSEAVVALDENPSWKDKWIRGYVWEVGTLSDGSLTYTITDDLGDNKPGDNLIQVVNGKGLNGADFTATTDLEVGQDITISGNLVKDGDVYKFEAGSQVEDIKELSDNPISADGDIELWASDLETTADVHDYINFDSENKGAFTFVSNDPTIATVDENGIVTPVSAGNTTITVNQAMHWGLYREGSVTVNVIVNSDTKTNNNFVLSSESKTTPYDTPVVLTYTVSEGYKGVIEVVTVNPSAIADVTVDPSNKTITITPLAVGSATIRIDANQDASFFTANRYFELEVTAPEGLETAPEATVFTKVTANNDLTDGEYLIVYEAGNVAFDGSQGTLDAVGNYIEVEINDGKIAADEKTLASTFTINVAARTLQSKSEYYIGQTSYANGLSKSEEADSYSNSFFIDDDGNAVITAEINADSQPTLRFNSASNQNRFRYYKSGQQAIQLYKLAGERISVTLNANGYATFSSIYPLDFNGWETKGYTAWLIDKVEGEVITFTQIGRDIKGGQGILLKGKPNATIEIPSSDSEFVLEDNKLVGITAPTYVTDDQYYGLKGETFVKVNAGTVKAGKAMLPVSALSGNEVKSFTFIFEGADGIKTVETVSAEEAKAIFNLAGQRLPKAQKGINIINGKKVLVK